MAKNNNAGSSRQPAPPSAPPLATEVLHRYAAGELPADAQHQVEARLLDSAFHRDAAEGFAAAGPTEVSAAHHDLLARLQQRVNDTAAAPAPAVGADVSQTAAPQLAVKARRRNRLLLIGAALLLIAILVPTILYRSYSNLQDEDAQAAKRRRAANYRGEDAQPQGFFDKLFGDDGPTPEEIAAKRAADSLKAVAQAQAIAEARARAEADAATAREAELARAREEENQRRAAVVPAAAAAAAPKPAAEPAVRRMRGQITTDAGVPIAGATVTLRATGRKAAAGADGWFALEVPSGTDPTLDVEAPGFVARTTRANGDGQVNVRLSTAEAVAVQSMTSAVAAEKRIRSVRPEPEGGYGSFYRYLAGAARMPDEARKEKVNGQVQVEFQVNPNGTLSDFRVVQSLGFGCDEEAVRVIQDGPKWSPGKANGEPVIKKVLMPVPFGR